MQPPRQDGSVEKWASKRGAKDRTQDVWHEQWGERRGGPTEGEPEGKFESCWAEQEGTNGFGERWNNGCAPAHTRDAARDAACPISTG